MIRPKPSSAEGEVAESHRADESNLFEKSIGVGDPETRRLVDSRACHHIRPDAHGCQSCHFEDAQQRSSLSGRSPFCQLNIVKKNHPR